MLHAALTTPTAPVAHDAGAPGGWWPEPLSPGHPAWVLQQAAMPGLVALSGQAACQLRLPGLPGAGDWTLALLQMPQDGTPARFDGEHATGDALLVAPAALWHLVCPPGSQWLAVQVQADLLAALWQRLYHKPLAAWLRQPVVLQATPARAQALRQLHQASLQQWLAAGDNRPDNWRAQRDELLSEWVEVIPERVHPSGLAPRQAARELVQRTRALVLARPEQAWPLAALCEQLGVHPKRLSASFQGHLGLTPARYLRGLRLQGVRRDLLQGGPDPACGVHDIAARWGFWHHGELAALYRQWFDELPSATLAAARAQRL